MTSQTLAPRREWLFWPVAAVAVTVFMLVLLLVLYILQQIFKIPLFFYHKARDGFIIVVYGPAIRREVLKLLARKVITHVSCGLPRVQWVVSNDPEGPIYHEAFLHIAGRDNHGKEWKYNWDPNSGVRDKGRLPTVKGFEEIRTHYKLMYWMLLPLVRAQRKTTPKFPVFAVNRCIYVNILPAALRLAA